MSSFKFAYLTIGLYLLIMGLVRYKKNKIKLSLISVVVILSFITIFARIVWYINAQPGDLRYLFALKLNNFKIAGAFIGGLVGLFILMVFFKKERRNLINTVIEGMFLVGGVAKAGCFISGCCLGKKTTLPWAVSYPEQGLYDLHPVQLYEALTWLIGLILLLQLKDKVKDKTRICISILVYIIIRMFIIEGLYSGGQFFGGPKMCIIYILAILVCVAIIVYDNRRLFKNEKEEV